MNTPVIDDVFCEVEQSRAKPERASDRLAQQYDFYCSEYFHLAELTPVCSLIYGLAYKLTHSGKNPFHVAAEHLGSYLNCSATTIRRGFQELENLGFLELKRSGRFRVNVYGVLSHIEWASLYPGRCCVKGTFPYSQEGDPLGQELWNITGGEVRFQKFQIDNLRKLEPSEERLIRLFDEFWESKGHRLPKTDVSPYFYKILKSHSLGGQN